MSEKIILGWGQSNNLAQTFEVALTAPWLGIGDPYAPVQLAYDMTWPSNGVDPPAFSGAWADLESHANGFGDFGPELTVGRVLGAVDPEYRIYKSASGATNLYSDWAHDSATTRQLWTRSQASLATHLATAGPGAAVAGMYWVQGVSDALVGATEANADAYGANLIEFVEQQRLIHGNIPFVFNQLHVDCTGIYTANVRAAQAAAAALIPNSIMINVDDLTFISNHFDANSIAELGNRLGLALLDLIGDPMAQFSNFLENALIDATLRGVAYASPANHYLSMHSAPVGEDGSGAELVGLGYGRQLIAFDAPSNGNTANSDPVAFTAAGGDWAEAVEVGIWDAPVGGNLLYYTTLVPVIVLDTTTFTFSPGQVTVALQ